MTVVRIKWDGGVLDMSVSGHAGYGPMGSDIICSAISMLTQTLAASLEHANENGALRRYRCRMEEGNVQIAAQVPPRYRKYVNGMMEMVTVGFQMLEEQYPEYVNTNMDNRPP